MKKIREAFDACNHNPIAFVIKGSPDPDAIASNLALLAYYKSLGGEGTIYHTDKVSHSANKTMINILDIKMTEIQDLSTITENYYVICDYSDASLQLENSSCVIHIDHHKEGETSEDIDYLQIIEYDVGACSTIVTLLLSEIDFFTSVSNSHQIATALAYGIKTDTDNLDGAREKDWEAMRILSSYTNKEDLRKITRSRTSPQTAEVLKKALITEKKEQNWLYAGIGFLQEAYRDSIAEVADKMMERQGIDNVLVYAIIERNSEASVQGSLRSVDASFDIDSFVKGFSDKAGGRKYKGGFEIPLGFWATCENRELLEQFTTTCIEGKLRNMLSTTKPKKKESKSDN